MGSAEEMKGLAEDIASSYEARISRLGEIRSETLALLDRVKSLVGQFEKARKEMALNQRKSLASDRANLSSEVKEMLETVNAERKETSDETRKRLAQATDEIKKEVEGMLERFTSLRKESANKLKVELAEDKERRTTEVKKLLASFDKSQELLRKELGKASDEWKKLVSTMEEKRAKKGEVKPKVVRKAKVEKPKEEVKEETLEEKIIRVVSENPNGITLPEIADTLGMPMVRLARPAKTLVDDGEVRKEEKLYYPAEG